MFEDLQGYVDFFILGDWVLNSRIRFLSAHLEGIGGNSYPQSSGEYQMYLKRTIEFSTLRNERIRGWASVNGQMPDPPAFPDSAAPQLNRNPS